MAAIFSRRASYLLALGVSIASLFITDLVEDYIGRAITVFPLVAVSFSAFVGGYRPGLLATLITTVALELFFIPPLYQFDIRSRETLAHLAVYIAGSVTVCALAETLRRRRQSEEDMRRHLEAERTLRERLTAAVTHDIRNPLSSARAACQVLLATRVTTKLQADILGRIIQNLDRMDQMIQDLLDASRVRAGHPLPLQIQRFYLSRLLEDVLVEVTMLYGERFVLRTERPVVGYWSPQSLRRVLENLVSNAVKYGAKDKPIVLSLRKIEDDSRVQLAVHNDGAGMTREELDQLFTPFQRGKAAEKFEQKGWGLGLTLTQGVTRTHGGRVFVESEPGKGATFTIDLPIDSRAAYEQALRSARAA